MVRTHRLWVCLLPAALVLGVAPVQAQDQTPPSIGTVESTVQAPAATAVPAAQVLPSAPDGKIAARATGGVLEALQNEITAIAKQTKSAVVTLEDARAVVFSYNTSELRKKDLEDTIQHLSIDKKAQDADLARVKTLYSNGATDVLTLNEAEHQSARLSQQLASQQRLLSGLGRMSQQEQTKQELEDKIALLKIDSDALDKRVKLLQQQVNAGVTDRSSLENALKERDHIVADLSSSVQRLHDAESNYSPLTVPQKSDVPTIIGRVPSDGSQVAYDNVFWAAREAPKSGTGFSIGEGYIVTTADVLQGMNNPVVVTDDGTTVRAKTVGIDTERNVGLVKLETNVSIPALILGDSTQVAPGHFVISIGNQAGQTNAIALNLVSGVRQEGTYSGSHFYPRLIEIGGTVGAGASGSPLVDARGEVIGVLAGVPAAEPASYFFSPPNKPQWETNRFGSTLPAPGQKESANSSKGAPSKPVPTPNNGKASPPSSQGNNPARQPGSAGLGAGSVGQPPLSLDPTGPTPDDSNGKNAPQAAIDPNFSQPYAYGEYYLGNQNSDKAAKDDYRNELFYRPATNGLQSNATPAETRAFYSLTPVVPSVTSAGFAIPINDLKPVIEDLRAGRPAKSIWIGIATKEEEHVTEENGIIHVEHTVRINGVYPDSPAYRAGIQPGDLLVSLDKKPMHNSADVHEVILHLHIGDAIGVELKHNGASKAVTLTITARPATLKPPITEPIKESL